MVLHFLNSWTAVRRPCWAVYPVTKTGAAAPKTAARPSVFLFTEQDAAAHYATNEALGLRSIHNPRELTVFLRDMLTLGYASAFLREGLAGRPLDVVTLMDAARNACEQELTSR